MNPFFLSALISAVLLTIVCGLKSDFPAVALGISAIGGWTVAIVEVRRNNFGSMNKYDPPVWLSLLIFGGILAFGTIVTLFAGGIL